MQHVYVLQQISKSLPDNHLPVIKVGITNNIERRIRELSSDNNTWDCIYSVETEYAREIEKLAHKRLKEERMANEFFICEPQVAIQAVEDAFVVKHGKTIGEYVCAKLDGLINDIGLGLDKDYKLSIADYLFVNITKMLSVHERTILNIVSSGIRKIEFIRQRFSQFNDLHDIQVKKSGSEGIFVFTVMSLVKKKQIYIQEYQGNVFIHIRKF